MATGIEKVLRESLLEWMLNFGTAARPGDAYYLQWHTADPGVAGATAKSASLPNRDVIAGTTPFWQAGAAGDGVAENKTAGESAVVGVGLGGDTINFFTVWSASTAGSFLFSGTVTTPQAVADGDKLSYAVGTLTTSITGAA